MNRRIQLNQRKRRMGERCLGLRFVRPTLRHARWAGIGTLIPVEMAEQIRVTLQRNQ